MKLVLLPGLWGCLSLPLSLPPSLSPSLSLSLPPSLSFDFYEGEDWNISRHDSVWCLFRKIDILSEVVVTFCLVQTVQTCHVIGRDTWFPELVFERPPESVENHQITKNDFLLNAFFMFGKKYDDTLIWGHPKENRISGKNVYRLLSRQSKLLTLLLMNLHGVRLNEVVVGQDLSQNSAPPRGLGRPGGELHGTLTSLGPANGAHVLTHHGFAHRYQSTFHAPQNRCATEALS